METPREALEGVLALTVGDALEEISQRQLPAAGGSSAALTAALAASLVSMVARSSRERWQDAGGAIAQAEALRIRLCRLTRSDADAHGHARTLLRGTELTRERRDAGSPPKAASLERERHDFQLAEALSAAAAAPLAIAEAAADVAALAAWAAHAGGADEQADAIAAAGLAEAAAWGSAQLVLVNLAVGLEDDAAVRAIKAARAAATSREHAASASSRAPVGL